MATLYKPDGTVETVSPADSAAFTLSEMQHLVGGYVEQAYGAPFTFYNEEGLLLGLPPNRRASELLGYPVVGNVLVCEREELRSKKSKPRRR